MRNIIIRLFITLICCFPVFASATTSSSIHVEWGYSPPTTAAVTGFKLYQEGVLACQVQDPSATAMDCQVTLSAATTNFTLSVTFSDGTESPQSSPFVFTTPGGTGTELKATLTADTLSGLAPLSVNFNAASSIGAITSYQWDFGDGSSATGNTTNHIYTTAGSYTAKLTVIDAAGLSSTTSTIVTVTAPVVPSTAVATTSSSIHVEWGYSPPTTPAVTGFKLYQEGVLACQVRDPKATAMDCQVTLSAATTNFTLSVTFSDGTESPQSSPFVFTTPGGTGTELKATLTADTLSGLAPLSVNFNAASSIGAITSYQWDFGDGSSATGNTTNHIYTTAGSYTTKLTVIDAAGLSTTTSAIVTVTAPTILSVAPPTAVVSSSTTAGAAPLAVNFNGSGSTAATGASIVAYSWSFGDGSSTTGASALHTFTTTGTYTTTMRVTDNTGLTSSASTPVVVTAPTVTKSIIPSAAATATPTTGTAPLVVTFTGSTSTDTDGTIASYLWNFGDGSSATGKTVTHTYSTEATFTATLQVTNNQGATNTTSIPITVHPANPVAGLNIELGEVMVSDQWVRVPLSSTFTNPVVVAGPPSYNGPKPCVIRLRNVSTTGFDIRVAEWNHLDGTHIAETVSYLVLEQGRTSLPDGSSVEAGTFQGTTSFNTIKFSKSFAKMPIIMTTIASVNEPDTISGRIKNIGLSNFSYYFREQEKNANIHVPETVNFIAWEPGKGTIGSMQYEVATTGKLITDAWYTKTFTKSYMRPPLLLADMQTSNDTDPSALRVQQVSSTGFQVKVEEEKSRSTNINHTAETIGYLTLDKVAN